MSNKGKAMELQDLRDEMLEKLEEMRTLIRECGNDDATAGAEAYWIPHVQMALTKDHGFLGGSMTDCEDTIDALYCA